MKTGFDFDKAIAQMKTQIAQEVNDHAKRIEFWKGYICAMEELQQWTEEQ